MVKIYQSLVTLLDNINSSRRRVLEKASIYSYFMATLLSIAVVAITIVMSLVLFPYYLFMAPQTSFDRLARRTDSGEFIDSFNSHMFYRRVSAGSLVGIGAIIVAATSLVNQAEKVNEPVVEVKNEVAVSAEQDLLTLSIDISDDHKTIIKLAAEGTRDCNKSDDSWQALYLTSASANQGSPLIDNNAAYQVSEIEASKEINTVKLEWDVKKFFTEAKSFGGECLFTRLTAVNEENEVKKTEIALHNTLTAEGKELKEVLTLGQKEEIKTLPQVTAAKKALTEFPLDKYTGGFIPTKTGKTILAAAGPMGGPHLKGFSQNGEKLNLNFMAYGSDMTGGVYAASGDIDGNKTKEIITGSGKYNHVRVFSQGGGVLGLNYFPFAKNYQGGVRVAAGDVDGDGVSEIAMATASENYVKVYRTNAQKHIVSEWAPYGSDYNKGVSVAMGDVDGDGQDEIITGSLKFGHVRVFEADGWFKNIDFFPFGRGYQNGVEVAVGDTDGDGADEIIMSEANGGSRVKIYEYNAARTIKRDFDSFAGWHEGVTVAAMDIDGDARQEVIVGAKAGGTPMVRVFGSVTDILLQQFYAFDRKFEGGVNVAGL